MELRQNFRDALARFEQAAGELVSLIDELLETGVDVDASSDASGLGDVASFLLRQRDVIGGATTHAASFRRLVGEIDYSSGGLLSENARNADATDSDRNPVTLDTLCRNEPEWAVNRIRAMKEKIDNAIERGERVEWDTEGALDDVLIILKRKG